jgi:hypothetical protein
MPSTRKRLGSRRCHVQPVKVGFRGFNPEIETTKNKVVASPTRREHCRKHDDCLARILLSVPVRTPLNLHRLSTRPDHARWEHGRHDCPSTLWKSQQRRCQSGSKVHGSPLAIGTRIFTSTLMMVAQGSYSRGGGKSCQRSEPCLP